MRGDKRISVTISTGTIAMTLALLLLLALLYFLKDLVLIVLTAIVIASSIEPAVAWMEMRGLPRVAGVLSMYLTIIVVLAGTFYLLLPPLVSETSGFLATLPQTFESVDPSFTESIGLGSGLLGEGRSLAEFLVSLQGVFSGTTGSLLHAVSAVFGGLVSLALVIVLSFYFAVQNTGIDDFLRLITPPAQQGYVVGLWRRSQQKIARWMQGQLILSLLAGVLVFLGLSLIGMGTGTRLYPFLLAVMAAILELVPVFGSIFAAIPAAAIAFAQGGSNLMVVVILLYVIINQFQGNLFYPLVVKKIIGLPPLVVILALIAGAQLAGFLGIILSVPIAAAIQEFIGDVQKRRALLTQNGE